VTGWGQVQAEIQTVEGTDPHGDHRYICEGDTALFQGEEGELVNNPEERIQHSEQGESLKSRILTF
jgi:hypothetical protein